METSNPSNPYKTSALKALAAVGFVAVLVFGAWGVIQVARMVPNLGGALSSAAVYLTSIFKPAERLEITIPSANIVSGEPFTLSWEHVGKRGDGTYTVTFDCRDGLEMQAPSQTGVYQKVFCNVPFNLTNEMSSMKLVAYSEKSRFLDVPVTLQFTRTVDGEVTAKTQTTLTVVNEKVSSTPSTGSTGNTGSTQPKTTTPRAAGTPTSNTYVISPGGRVSDPNGHPDLQVTILETGYINRGTNVFTPATSINRIDRGAVRFVVENVGTKTVDGWMFNAVLPTYPHHIFSSTMQPALAPGDRIEYTLGFDSVDPSTTGSTLTVNVDPTNTVWNDTNKGNNIAKVIYTIIN